MPEINQENSDNSTPPPSSSVEAIPSTAAPDLDHSFTSSADSRIDKTSQISSVPPDPLSITKLSLSPSPSTISTELDDDISIGTDHLELELSPSPSTISTELDDDISIGTDHLELELSPSPSSISTEPNSDIGIGADHLELELSPSSSSISTEPNSDIGIGADHPELELSPSELSETDKNFKMIGDLAAMLAQIAAASTRLVLTRDYYSGNSDPGFEKTLSKAMKSGQLSKLNKYARLTTVFIAGIIHGAQNSEDLAVNEKLLPTLIDQVCAEISSIGSISLTQEFSDAQAAICKKLAAADKNAEDGGVEKALSVLPNSKESLALNFLVRKVVKERTGDSVTSKTDAVESTVGAIEAVLAKHVFEIGQSIGDKLSKTARSSDTTKAILDSNAAHKIGTLFSSTMYTIGVVLENVEKVIKVPVSMGNFLVAGVLDGVIEATTTPKEAEEIAGAIDDVPIPQNLPLMQQIRSTYNNAYEAAEKAATKIDDKLEKGGVGAIVSTNAQKSKRAAEHSLRKNSNKTYVSYMDKVQFTLSASARTSTFLAYKAIKWSTKSLVTSIYNSAVSAFSAAISQDPFAFPNLSVNDDSLVYNITPEHQQGYNQYLTQLLPDAQPITLAQFAKEQILKEEYDTLPELDKPPFEQYKEENASLLKLGLNATVEDLEEYAALRREGNEQAQQSFIDYFMEKAIASGVDPLLVNIDFSTPLDDSNHSMLGIDILNLDLSGADLSGINFSGANFYGTDLRATILNQTNLKDADLRFAKNLDISNTKDIEFNDNTLIKSGWIGNYNYQQFVHKYHPKLAPQLLPQERSPDISFQQPKGDDGLRSRRIPSIVRQQNELS